MKKHLQLVETKDDGIDLNDELCSAKPHVLDYVMSKYGPDLFNQAWRQFARRPEMFGVHFDPEECEPILTLFMDYVLCNFTSPVQGQTRMSLVEEFLSTQSEKLDAKQKDLLSAMVNSRFSYYRFSKGKKSGAKAKCEITGKTFKAESLSGDLENGEVFFARFITYKGEDILSSVGDLTFQGQERKYVTDLKSLVFKMMDTKKISDLQLLYVDDMILDSYIDQNASDLQQMELEESESLADELFADEFELSPMKFSSEAVEEDYLKSLEAMAAKRRTDWFDVPIPMLDHKTPREAARTKKGRLLLEDLIKIYGDNFEHAKGKKSLATSMNPTPAEIRAELKL